MRMSEILMPAIAAIAICGFIYIDATTPIAQAATTAPLPRWEYTYTLLPAQVTLNDYGSKGWEAYAVDRTGYMYFKRRLR